MSKNFEGNSGGVEPPSEEKLHEEFINMQKEQYRPTIGGSEVPFLRPDRNSTALEDSEKRRAQQQESGGGTTNPKEEKMWSEFNQNNSGTGTAENDSSEAK